MTNKNWDSHTMRNKLNSRIQDFLRFGSHFPFFLGKAVLKENINMGNRIKSNLLGKNFRLYRIINIDALCLIK